MKGKRKVIIGNKVRNKMCFMKVNGTCMCTFVKGDMKVMEG